jgi:hypothetical protein
MACSGTALPFYNVNNYYDNGFLNNWHLLGVFLYLNGDAISPAHAQDVLLKYIQTQ